MRVLWLVAGCLAAAALSLLLVPAAPGYDAWAWLLWGREAGRLELDTVAGPAFKPLPVAIAALLAPAGAAAPELWLLVARAGAVAALVLAAVLAWRLADPRGAKPAHRAGFAPLAAGLAAAGVALTAGFVRHAAVGDAEPLLVALMLGAVLLALDGRHRAALAVGAAAALIRPEVWPFLAVYGLWRRREDRVLVAAIAIGVPAVWFLPELAGSGELLRSTGRARIPNPGQPATADVPALETLATAFSVVLLPAAILALAARGRAALLALAGVAWIVLVALMSQAGFSGEPRYLVPGASLIAVAGGIGAARLGPRPVAIAAVAAVALFALPRAGDIADLGPRLAYQHDLARELERLVTSAGRERLLACGRPAVGRYRGTMLAWHLDVPKRTVRADGRPSDVTFRSRLTARGPVSPPSGEAVVAADRTWEVRAGCPGLWHAFAP